MESLLAWDIDVGRLAETREQLRQRAAYPAAALRLAANMQRDRDADPKLAAMFKDAGLTVAALSAAYLHATGGVSLARLKAFIRGFGLTSPGRARTILAYMRHLGYVEPDPGNRPSRPALYHLTPDFMASYKRHEASVLDAMQLVEPAVGVLLANLGAPGVFETLVRTQGDAFVAGSLQAREYGAWYRVFMHRHAGTQIVHALVAASEVFPPEDPFSLPVAVTARRYKVSRAHMTRMLEDAHTEGFITTDAAGLRFTGAGRDALDWLYASRITVNLACLARTARAHPELWAQGPVAGISDAA